MYKRGKKLVELALEKKNCLNPGPSTIIDDDHVLSNESLHLSSDDSINDKYYNPSSDAEETDSDNNESEISVIKESVNLHVAKRVTHTFIKPTGPGKKKRKICRECYKQLRSTLSSHEANSKVTKVTSFCQGCPGEPGMCLPCFNKKHKQ